MSVSPDKKIEKRANSSSSSIAHARIRHERGSSLAGRRPPSVLAQSIEVSQISLEEWETLLQGEYYLCQTNSSESDRDVVLCVSITGIKVLDSTERNILSEFDIEQILQYSYSQQNSTFSFSYLEEGRFFVTHKFQTPQFLEIHQYLGNAISIVIKIKTQMKSGHPADLLQLIETAMNEKRDSPLRIKVDPRRSKKLEGEEDSDQAPDTPDSEKPLTPTSSAAERLTSLFSPPPISPGGTSPSASDPQISQVTYKKSNEAKNYFEGRYKNRPDAAERLRERRALRTSFEDGKKEEERSKSPDLFKRSDSAMSVTSQAKKSSTLKAGSIRVKDILPMEFQFLSIRKKKPADLEKLRNNSFADFAEYNPEQLPETIHKNDENGVPVLIKTMIEGKYQITAGTVDALIEALADHQQPDSLYIDVFLQTYRNFLSPVELISRLRKRLNMETMKVIKEEIYKAKDASHSGEVTELDSDMLAIVRMRIASVIKKWVERHWYDFELQDVRAELDQAMDDMKAKGIESVLAQIKNTIKKHEEDHKSNEMFIIPKNEPITNFDFSAAPPKEVAQAMTVIALDYLKAISPDEFVFFLWGKKSDPRTEKMKRNLQRLIDRFNKVGFWVSTEICACQDLKKRVTVLEKFILIAKSLFKYKNYNDLIAVLFGLNSIPVYRLKKTWALIPQRVMSVYRDLEDKMKADNNYKQYRAIEFESQPPYIPFFALYMKDLTFMNDGNQTYLSNQMVNVEKHRSINDAIMSIRSSQQSDYKFSVDEYLRRYCETMYFKDEEELKEQSYGLEPSARQTRRPSVASVGSELSTETTEEYIEATTPNEE